METKSYDSWKWLLMLVVDDLDLRNDYGYTFI